MGGLRRGKECDSWGAGRTGAVKRCPRSSGETCAGTASTKGERQSVQMEQWSSSLCGLAGGEDPARPSEEAPGIIVVSLQDVQTSGAVSGHGLHTIASAEEASACRISTPRSTLRKKVWEYIL